MNDDLTQKKCQPCEGIGKALDSSEAQKYVSKVQGWNLSDDHKTISQNFVMKNFSGAVALINSIKDVAEDEDHHPDIHLTGYRNLKIDLSTHALGGLTENDFIVAAKIDALPKELKT